MRLFIAINIPNEIKENLGRQAADLARRIDATGIKWVEPELFHLTLRFLGELPEHQVEPLAGQMTVAAKDIRPFSISFDKAGCFPPHGSPRVLWFGMKEGKEQAETAGKAFTLIGPQEETERAFQAHLTIARVKDPRSSRFIRPVLEKWIFTPPPPFEVRSIDLMQSVPSRTGPAYSLVQSVPLH
jgi:2'-5' RNA ligase